nr:uncharacterized protein LOC105324186 isoform X4 [Crassostrea gigas]
MFDVTVGCVNTKMAASMTPRKIYSSTNICNLCGFSFTVKEIDENSKATVKKLSKLKFRLSEEKRAAICQVTTIPDNTDGVCTKCFSKVKKVIKYRKEITVIISQFEDHMKRNLSKTPGSRKKRLLISPQYFDRQLYQRPSWFIFVKGLYRPMRFTIYLHVNKDPCCQGLKI